MSLENIIVDDYGQVIELTIIDIDTDAAADVSSYTTAQTMIFTNPAGTVTVKIASFKTDGSDGIIRYTVQENFLSQAGVWRVRARVTSGSAKLTSVTHKFDVLALPEEV